MKVLILQGSPRANGNTAALSFYRNMGMSVQKTTMEKRIMA